MWVVVFIGTEAADGFVTRVTGQFATENAAQLWAMDAGMRADEECYEVLEVEPPER